MTYETPVTQTLNNHVSIRYFEQKPVPEEMLTAVLEAARRSPTSSNMQTYSIIVVRDQETKKRISPLAGNQRHIETCDVFLAFCADIHRLEAAAQMHDVQMVKTLETTIIATVDAALVGMSVQTAAESFGLGAVMIGGMRNHPVQAAQLLGLPQGVYVVYGMCLGWPRADRIPPQKPRLPRQLVIHYEQYDRGDPRPALEIYDDELADHYGRLGGSRHDSAWTGPIASRLAEPRRPHLRADLETLGFRFD